MRIFVKARPCKIFADLPLERFWTREPLFRPYSPQETHSQFTAVEILSAVEDKYFAMKFVRIRRKGWPNAHIA